MTKRIFLIAFFFMTLLIWSTFSISAQNGDSKGVDILFLIDESASMNINDPNELRFYSPWYAMYWMGELGVLKPEDYDFRMAVVHFGAGVVDARDVNQTWKFLKKPDWEGDTWQVINPQSKDAWAPLFKDLDKDILTNMKEEIQEENFGKTNFLGAFETA